MPEPEAAGAGDAARIREAASGRAKGFPGPYYASPARSAMDTGLNESLDELFSISPPMRDALEVNPAWRAFVLAVPDGDWAPEWSPQAIPSLLDQLRAFRRREFARIALADIAGLWSFETTVGRLSSLADWIVAATLRHCWEVMLGEAASAGSFPACPEGFAVFALGKLGGRELNYSSDIDLVFCRRSSDEPAELRFFTRLGERLVQAMTHAGPQGFLYRVDMRLRPHGETGPLVPTIDSLIGYYESWGEAWERQALIKARFVAGDENLGRRFGEFVRRYVFARQMDDWSLEELKRIKHRAEKEHAASAKRIHLKQGPGGIRDIEFYTQYHQLIAGPTHEAARSATTLEALAGLAAARVLLEGEESQLALAYRFLRIVEHRLQLRSLTPQALLPESPAELDLLAKGLGFADARAFESVLEGYRRRVRRILERIYLTPGYLRLSEREEEFAQLLSERTPKSRVRELLSGYGFQDADKAWQNLRLLALGPAGRHLPPGERRVFLEFVFPLLEVMRDSIDPDLALHHLEGFAAASGNRISFLRTLASRRPHLVRLTNLLATSKLCHQILSRHPEFFDSLARGVHLHEGRTAEEMGAELRQRFGAAPKREPRELILRRYRQREMVRIAYRDMAGLSDMLETSRELSDLAEACVLVAVEITRPVPEDVFCSAADPMVVIAGGKLGSRQMHYASDVDLLFFYQGLGPDAPAESRAAVQQELDARVEGALEMLKAVTAEGVAYQVDLRLRPEGTAGLLARSWEGFLEYAHQFMQPWERMAMVRTRALGGFPPVAARWDEILLEVTYGFKWDADAVESIRHMKRRLETEKNRESRTCLDFKYGKGGIADLEHLVKFLQLFYGHRRRAARAPAIAEALPALRDEGAVSSDECDALLEGHRFLRRVENHYQLQEEWPLREVSRESPGLGRLARSLGYLGGSAAEARKRFVADWEERSRSVRRLVEKYFYERVS